MTEEKMGECGIVAEFGEGWTDAELPKAIAGTRLVLAYLRARDGWNLATNALRSDLERMEKALEIRSRNN